MIRLSLWFITFISLVGASIAGWAYFVEPGWVKLVEHEVIDERWPNPPLRIAVLGDPHTGSNGMGLEDLARVVERTNAEAPDIVLLLGDYINHRGGIGLVEPEATAAVLAGLSSRLGSVSVLGNHDWWYDGERVRRSLEQEGIPVLENQAMKIADGNFWLVGLADDSTRNVDLVAVIANLPSGVPVIAMGHDPVSFEHARQDWIIYFAGHAHAGQVRIPFYGPIWMPGRTPKKYSYGMIVEDGRRMYVTSGLGESILPVRFNARPEIALVTIRGKSS